MPTFDYFCRKCLVRSTLSQRDYKKKRKCPACKQLGLRRCVSTGIGVIFKGTGFYETDYRRKQ